MAQRHCPQRFCALFETLESRVLLSASVSLAPSAILPHDDLFGGADAPHPGSSASGINYPIAAHHAIAAASTSPPSSAKTPLQLRTAYGLTDVSFGAIAGDGAGITIAIVDAYDYPTAASDLNAFSSYYSLPLFNQGGTSPTFTKVNQTGGTSYPAANSGWANEASLDIEWAHAIAPMANIILVEANSAFDSDLYAAVDWARSTSAATIVSMSWGGDETSGDVSSNFHFTTPAGHPGVTFLASTGDSGAYSASTNNLITPSYPAISPNVVAVGGTSLFLSGNNYSSESGWGNGTSSQSSGGSGGGISAYQAKPSYQAAITYSVTNRTIPDVSMLADPNTGVAIYNAYVNGASTPWNGLWGGTSLAAPLWSGVMAIVDQGRVLAGLGTLDGATQALPALYNIAASNYHDIVAGANGPSPTYVAGPGYDLVTGRGSPIASTLIPALIGAGTISGTVFQDNNSNATQDAGEPGLANVTVYLDANNNAARDLSTSFSASSANVPLSIPDNNSTGVTSTLAIANTGIIADINFTFSITHTYDADLTGYLIAPDNTQIILFSAVGGSSNNFTNTTLDDSAATSITSGTAPFTGTFRPSPGALSTFNGKSAAGTWKFKVVDGARRDTGTIDAWSLAITTASETATTTNAGGNYTFSVAAGTYTVRELAPAGFVESSPSPGGARTPNVAPAGTTPNQNFGNFPTLFAGTSGANAFYLRQDTQSNLQIFTATNPAGTPAYSVPVAILPALTFNLLGGADTFTVDLANGPLPANGVTVNAGGNTNDLLHVLGTGLGQNATISNTQFIPPTGGTLNLSGFDSLTATSITLNDSASLFTALAIDPTARVNVTNAGSPRVLFLKSLTISSGGTLNIGNNDLIIDYSAGPNPAAILEAAIRSGYNGGNWLGAGITSSAAAADSGNYSVNILDNAASPTPFTTFDSVAVSSTVILIKFTYVDDLLLTGTVNSNDAILFANNYSEGAPATHALGDLNYNGFLDSNDAILFANSYNEGLPPMPPI